MEMLRLTIDAPAMFRRLRSHRLPSRAADTGYQVHAFMQELFSGRAPSPFRIGQARGREIEVLAYSDSGGRDLGATSDGVLGFASKPMPERYLLGAEYRFSVLACPVVRMSSDGPTHRKGAEVDVFLRECWRKGSDCAVDRELVYRRWLEEQVARHGGAEVRRCRVLRWGQRRLLRKTQGTERKSRQRDKPEVEFEGILRVTESDRFAGLLRRGIGRHRAFGFGMLLLRRS